MFVPPLQVASHVRTIALATVAFTASIIVVYAGWRLDVAPHFGNASPDLVPRWVVLSVIVFLAASVSSVVGFAFSAIAGAMILHYVPSGIEAVQIMMAASIGIQAYSVAGLWQSIRWSRCAPFIVGGVAALPLGIGLLLSLEPQGYVPAIGAMLAGYGVYMMLRRPLPSRGGERRVADALIGAIGGITGPLAALPAAFMTIWCGMREWSKVEQRAVYQPYILVMQIVAFAALQFTQGQSVPDSELLAYALLGVVGATIGLRVFRALSEAQFQRIVNVALIVSGLTLALK